MKHTHRGQRAHGRTLRSQLLLDQPLTVNASEEWTYSKVDTTGYPES